MAFRSDFLEAYYTSLDRAQRQREMQAQREMERARLDQQAQQHREGIDLQKMELAEQSRRATAEQQFREMLANRQAEQQGFDLQVKGLARPARQGGVLELPSMEVPGAPSAIPPGMVGPVNPATAPLDLSSLPSHTPAISLPIPGDVIPATKFGSQSLSPVSMEEQNARAIEAKNTAMTSELEARKAAGMKMIKTLNLDPITSNEFLHNIMFGTNPPSKDIVSQYVYKRMGEGAKFLDAFREIAPVYQSMHSDPSTAAYHGAQIAAINEGLKDKRLSNEADQVLTDVQGKVLPGLKDGINDPQAIPLVLAELDKRVKGGMVKPEVAGAARRLIQGHIQQRSQGMIDPIQAFIMGRMAASSLPPQTGNK